MTVSGTPGTSNVVVRSPALAAPWDYGPEAIDLRGTQLTPRLRPPRRRLTRDRPDSEVPATPTPRPPGRA